MCRVRKYFETRRVLQCSVAVSEADMDASKKPLTAKNMEVAFSATFFAVMGFCWHPRPPQKWPQKCSIL